MSSMLSSLCFMLNRPGIYMLYQCVLRFALPLHFGLSNKSPLLFKTDLILLITGFWYNLNMFYYALLNFRIICIDLIAYFCHFCVLFFIQFPP